VYQSQVADNNAKIARWNAAITRQSSEIEQQDLDHQAAGQMGELVAAQGASGVSLGSPSSMRTRSTAAALSREDALRVRYKGSMDAWNYDNQAKDFKSQSQISLLGGFVKAASSLVGSASSVSDKWSWMKMQEDYAAS
jgi:hypothetical protein